MALDIRKAFSARVAATKCSNLIHKAFIAEHHTFNDAIQWLADSKLSGYYRYTLESVDHPTMAALYRFHFDNMTTAIRFAKRFG